METRHYADIHIRAAIEQLLSAYALANMSKTNPKLLDSALGWFDSIEGSIRSARAELEDAIKTGSDDVS